MNDFLTKINPLKKSNKLGAVLVQLPPSFSVSQFKNTEGFLDKLPARYQYVLEFRYRSLETEGPSEMLKHYNVAGVTTDSPDPGLQYLSDISLTADHALIRLHGRNPGYWYNYSYDRNELEPWVSKVDKIKSDLRVKTLRMYFNNHHGAKSSRKCACIQRIAGRGINPGETGCKKLSA